MLGLVLGTIFVGTVPMIIYRRRANEPIQKHKRGGGSSILAVCLILLLFLTQALGANLCNNAGGICKPGGARNKIHAGEEFDPRREDVRDDQDDYDQFEL
ncbi:PREDICTED: uncharacterized protein LOC104706552 [Camelina sativa]|uniref:Uncharacterized protein LOC104706552 n=1 Tax=Camelina sativa TaxID=90675 RepID=A0ABM0T578_CAMSA|nr:PREDICTED: uncharacterized protein LOC104706552 [Camelina sativa]